MKSLFLNKSKKYIAGFLCLIFLFGLFFSPQQSFWVVWSGGYGNSNIGAHA